MCQSEVVQAIRVSAGHKFTDYLLSAPRETTKFFLFFFFGEIIKSKRLCADAGHDF